MEGHYMHPLGRGLREQAVPRGDGAFRLQVEAVPPFRILEVQRMHRRVSQMEQLLAVRAQE